MNWEIIKYAINSSLGNENFSPLNDIVDYNTEFVIDASTDKLTTVIEGKVLSAEKETKKCVLRMSGKIIVKFETHIDASGGNPLYNIYKNGNLVYQKTSNDDGYSSEISVEKGDEITIEYSETNGVYTEANIYICGFLRSRRILDEI